MGQVLINWWWRIKDLYVCGELQVSVRKIIDPPTWGNIYDAQGKQNIKIKLWTDFSHKTYNTEKDKHMDSSVF